VRRQSRFVSRLVRRHGNEDGCSWR
jgi:hypothetical protein